MCWFHCIFNVDKKLRLIPDTKIQAEVRADIEELQTCPTQDLFWVGVGLFEKKWQAQSDFLAYFKENWLNKNSNWYEGFSLRTPSTNNGLEAINRTIKKENTMRERLPLPRFLTVAEDIVKGWSLTRGSDTFSDQPVPDLELWTKAFQWATGGTEAKDLGNGNYMIKSSSSSTKAKLANLIEKKRRKESRGNWLNFDEFVQIKNSVWEVTGLHQDSMFVANCTCEQGLKKYLCKHILGIALRMGFCPCTSCCQRHTHQDQKETWPSVQGQESIDPTINL